MLYPVYSYLYNEYKNAQVAAEYQASVRAADPEQMRYELEMAREYNAFHSMNVITDPFGDDEETREGSAEYRELLSMPDDEAMAYLEIPKIGQSLPVYHGTSNEVLEQGIGHLPGTSLPVGGESSHCVLSGHRGLPTKKLFTDLDQLKPGDQFFIHVFGDDLAYEVDNIQVVEPTQIDGLSLQPGQDLVTLVTCTPYGVNTHRMLVTGHRVPYEAPAEEPSVFNWLGVFSQQTLVLAGVLSLVAVITLIVLIRRLRGRGRNER